MWCYFKQVYLSFLRKEANEILAGLICVWIYVWFTVHFCDLLITIKFLGLIQPVWEKNSNLKDKFPTLYEMCSKVETERNVFLWPKERLWCAHSPDTRKDTREPNCRTQILGNNLQCWVFLLFNWFPGMPTVSFRRCWGSDGRSFPLRAS